MVLQEKNLPPKGNECERCGRAIRHKGRCLPCNYLYKHKTFYPGIERGPEYDMTHGFDLTIVEEVLALKKPKLRTSESTTEEPERKHFYPGRKCLVCKNEFHSKPEYKVCFRCFKFYREFGWITQYKEYLETFKVEDSSESKDHYIQFIDGKQRFLENRKEPWSIEKVLKDPAKFLDQVEPGERRKKKKK